ncbi:hypothetical protein [Nonomuraea sp. B19D2]|uniref:hypothetical protein n=1 Tax=Nonomuraea sp. B19D2 TaxID=3159561 RepID=UPI0032DB5A2A
MPALASAALVGVLVAAGLARRGIRAETRRRGECFRRVRRGADDPAKTHRDYKTHLKTVAKRKADTVNAHLAALDHFFTHPGLGPVQVPPEPAG